MGTTTAVPETTTWDINLPQDTMCGEDIPGEIRQARDELAHRAQQEHSFLTDTPDGGRPGDFGGVHKAGSARAFVDSGLPSVQVANMTGLATNNSARSTIDSDLDEGRLYVDTDSDGLYYINGTTWTEVAIVGAISGANEYSNLVLLGGRASGQTINGGTAASEDLTLASTAHETKGSIVLESGTDDVTTNNVPFKGLTLDDNMDASDNKITALGAATAFKDAIRKEDNATKIGVLTSADVEQDEATVDAAGDGGIACAAHGQGTCSDSADQTADIGFAPDFILAWNDTANSAVAWNSEVNATKRMDGGHYDTSAGNKDITVSGDIITFPHTHDRVNGAAGTNFYYIAIKTNHRKDPG
ncbi:MAG: hypothetical protein Unbinned400contig1000_24 [Prokaryotic dsDNA virus sp.]|nr:MAG: hypothetical protein Unbinned400contig1000_24 [Prokaryotic dsDNA virus sp.]|tara:strand:+ start:13533 stop:14606 length:1074 start_codon:yes stop_codon:yes gene_type:complete